MCLLFSLWDKSRAHATASSSSFRVAYAVVVEFCNTLREVLNWNARYSNSIEVGSLVGMRNEMGNEKLLEVSSNKMLTCK